MSLAGVSPRLIKYHDNYLIGTDDAIHVVDIVTSESSYVTINNNIYIPNLVYVNSLHVYQVQSAG